MKVASESGDALEELHLIALELVKKRRGLSGGFILPSFKGSDILDLVRLTGSRRDCVEIAKQHSRAN